MAEEKIIINVDTSSSSKSLKDLKQELKDAKSAMLEAQEGSEEYSQALKRASQASLEMKEMNEAIKGSQADFGEVLGNTTNIIGGLVGGMNAVKGVSALLGTENEQLEKTFVKLQAGMAIVQGLQGIDGMLKGFTNLGNVMKNTQLGIKSLIVIQKAWNFVMSLNPIFLLVTALAAAAAGIVYLTNVMRTNNAEQMESNRLLEDYKNKIELTNTLNDNRIKILQAEGKTESELYTAKVNNLTDIIKLQQEEIERLKEKRNINGELSAEEQESLDELLKAHKENQKKMNDLLFDSVAEVIRTNKKKEDENKKAAEQKLKAEQDAAKKLAEQQKKDREDREKEVAEQVSKDLDEIDKINREVLLKTMNQTEQELFLLEERYKKEKQLLEDYNESTLILTQNYEKEKAEITNRESDEKKKKILEENDELKNINFEYRLNDLLNFKGTVSEQLKAIDDAAALKMEKLNTEYAAEKAEREKLGIDTTELTTYYEFEKTQIEKEQSDARRSIKEAEYQANLMLAMGTANLLTSMGQLAGEQTEAGKALAIAGATISMLASAVDAYRSTVGIPYVGPYLAPINAAAAITAGLIQIKQIKAVKVPAKKGGGSSSQNAPSVSIPKAPSLNQKVDAVRNVNTEKEIELQKQPIKAYVVESEISEKQNKVKNIKDESSF